MKEKTPHGEFHIYDAHSRDISRKISVVAIIVLIITIAICFCFAY